MKILCSILLLVLAIAPCAADQLATYTHPKSSKVTLEPSLSSKTVGVLKEGYVFTLVDENIEPDFYLVSLLDGKAGWLKKRRAKLFKINDSRYSEHFLEIEDDNTRAFVPERTRAKSPIKIVVSLKGLTCHMTGPGIDKVYPVGVGVKGSSGKSITPTSKQQGVDSFYLHKDTSNTWYYMKNRYSPAYFGGFPFLRLSAVNSKGYNTYGLHGPITKNKSTGKWYLQRGYVSHGCARMRGEDVTEIYNTVIDHASTPVLIQQDYEYDEDGKVIDVDYPRYN